ncbi:MAG: VOC family protein [Coriobacteriia bacterium]
MTTTTLSRLSTAPASAVLPAEDLERARTFYTETLGLPVIDMPGDQFMISAGAGTRVLVYHRPRTVAEHTVLTFIVDDIHATMSDLMSRSVVFEDYDLPDLKTVDGVAESETEHAAWFRDTEGNIINIAQMK